MLMLLSICVNNVLYWKFIILLSILIDHEFRVRKLKIRDDTALDFKYLNQTGPVNQYDILSASNHLIF